MASKKIYELAREVGKPSKEVASWAKDAGFDVKSHMSSVDEGVAQKILEGLKKDGLISSEKDATKIKKSSKKTPAKTKEKAKTKKTEDPELVDELEQGDVPELVHADHDDGQSPI